MKKMNNFNNYTFLLVLFVLLSPSLYANNTLKASLMKAADNKKSGSYVRTAFLKVLKRPFNNHDKRPKALIIGDSHAQDLYNALNENAALENYQISTRYIPTICQTYWGKQPQTDFIDPSHTSQCAKADNLQRAKSHINQADLVILASNWKLWSAGRLPETLGNLKLKPSQQLLVLGRKNFGKVNIRQYLRMPAAKLVNLRNGVDSRQMKINQVMQRNVPAKNFINIHQLVCGGQGTCPLFTKDKALISFDGGHLTQDGAKYVGDLLLKRSKLKQLIVKP